MQIIWGYWRDIGGFKDLTNPEGVRSGSGLVWMRLLKGFLTHIYTPDTLSHSLWTGSYILDNALCVNVCVSMCVMSKWAQFYPQPWAMFKPQSQYW